MSKVQKSKKLPPALRVIGARAEEARGRTGLTQKALAEKLGVAASQISRFEGGTRMVELETLLELCKALGAPVGYIIGGEGALPAVEFVETDKRRRGD